MPSSRVSSTRWAVMWKAVAQPTKLPKACIASGISKISSAAQFPTSQAKTMELAMTLKEQVQQSKGQAQLEAVVASLSLLSFAVLLLALIYFCALKTYLQFSSHELLVCRE